MAVSMLSGRLFTSYMCQSMHKVGRWRHLQRLSKEGEKTLAMFPEFDSATKFALEGSFQKAIPHYERMLDILRIMSTSSSSGEAIMHLLTNVVKLHCYTNNAKKGLHLLNEALQLPLLNEHDAVGLHFLQAHCFLWLKEYQSAAKASKMATDIAEHTSSQVEVSLLSDVYHSRGVSNMLLLNLDEAETYLQLATRWAQEPSQRLRTTTNYGTLEWYRLASEDSFNIWQHRLAVIEANPKDILANKDTINQKILTNNQTAMKSIQHALNIWQEAIHDLFTGSSSASMCGPSSPSIGMTGLGEKENIHSFSTTTQEDQVKEQGKSQDELLAAALLDVEFAVAYAHLLSNIAEGLEFVSDSSSESASYLSSALKTVSGHENDIRTYAVIARILRLIAMANAKMGQAVTAEGLYRSAIDKYSSPYALFDPRSQYEAALTKGLYAQILCSWDRREQQGETLKAVSLQELKPLYSSAAVKAVPLSGMISLPLLML